MPRKVEIFENYPHFGTVQEGALKIGLASQKKSGRQSRQGVLVGRSSVRNKGNRPCTTDEQTPFNNNVTSLKKPGKNIGDIREKRDILRR